MTTTPTRLKAVKIKTIEFQWFISITVQQLINMSIFLIISGTDILRTCTNERLNDCAVANDVIYCYCTGDLCNKEKAKLVRQRELTKRKTNEMHLRTPATTDDEDLEESSGLGELQRPVSQQTKKQLITPTDHHLLQQQSAQNNNKKGWMITLKPATEALNLTTSSPSRATTVTVTMITTSMLLVLTKLLHWLNFHYDSIII